MSCSIPEAASHGETLNSPTVTLFFCKIYFRTNNRDTAVKPLLTFTFTYLLLLT